MYFLNYFLAFQKIVFRGFINDLRYNLIKMKGSFVEYKKFKEILKKNKLTVKKFSELAGISYSTCNTWSNRGAVSAWVESWLNLYNQNINFKENSNDTLNREYQELLQLKESLQAVVNRVNQ